MFLKQNVSTYILVGPFVTSANVMTTALTTAAVLLVSQNGLASTMQPITTVVIASSQTMMFRVDLSSASVAHLGPWVMIGQQTVGIKMNYAILANVVSSNYFDQMFGTSAIGGAASTLSASEIWNFSTRTLTSADSVWSATSRTLTSWGGISTAAGGGSTVTIPDIWAYSTRNLTSWNGISTAAPSTLAAADVWGYSTRNLTSFGVTLGADVWAVTTKAVTAVPASTWGAVDVWSYSSRLLTSGAVAQSTFTAADVWAVASRTLTSTPVSTWGPSDVWSYSARMLTSGAVVWNQILDGTTLSYEMGMKGLSAAVLGESTGGGTTAVGFRNFNGTTVSTANRLAYQVSTVGNRVLTGFSW